jgi:hypothetical protein
MVMIDEQELKNTMIFDVDGVQVRVVNTDDDSKVEIFDEELQLIGGRRYRWTLETDNERWKRMQTDIATDIQNWRN